MLDKDTLLLEKPASGLCYKPHCKTVSLSWCRGGLALEWLRGADWPLLRQTSAPPAHGALHFVTFPDCQREEEVLLLLVLLPSFRERRVDDFTSALVKEEGVVSL